LLVIATSHTTMHSSINIKFGKDREVNGQGLFT